MEACIESHDENGFFQKRITSVYEDKILFTKNVLTLYLQHLRNTI